MTSREFFEDARSASMELHRHDLRYDAMERRAMSLGGSISMMPHRKDSDSMSKVDYMVDYESRMSGRVRVWCDAIDRATSVLYGSDWKHGIAMSLSMSHAEVLECIYIQRMTLAQTAQRVHWSVRKVCELRTEALKHIDDVGITRAMAGE